jgi:hypothetical protein
VICEEDKDEYDERSNPIVVDSFVLTESLDYFMGIDDVPCERSRSRRVVRRGVRAGRGIALCGVDRSCKPFSIAAPLPFETRKVSQRQSLVVRAYNEGYECLKVRVRESDWSDHKGK